MTDEGTSKHPPIGPVGERVIANVEELRQIRGLSFRDLAARLAELGRPIGSAVLHRLSQGRRRVDADDLVALAVALGVTTDSLLLDRHARRDEMMDLTPAFRQRADVVWAWADGREPMPAHQVDEGGVVRRTLAEQIDFATNARPALDARRSHPTVLAAEQFIGAVMRALLDLDEETGAWKDEESREKQRENVTRALQRVALEVDEMFAGAPPFTQPNTAVRAHPAAHTGHGKGSSGRGDADVRL